MGIIKKVTILSVITAAVIGALSKFMTRRKYEVSAAKMSIWECKRKDLKTLFVKMFKMWRMWRKQKETPGKWRKFFRFA